MNFVDIAGLVRGASQGEGLGNQFLSNIRETDAIAYVLRCFDDEDVTHVEGKIDPLADLETVQTELMLADMESLEKRSPALAKKAKNGDKEAILTLKMIDLAMEALNEGLPARTAKVDHDDRVAWRMLQLLTAKPVLYVANVDEDSAATGNAYSETVFAHAKAENAEAVVISAQIESEIALLDNEERTEYLDALGLTEPGLNRMIQTGYKLLGLETYFTVGPKEARAWTFHEGLERAALRWRHPHRFRTRLHPAPKPRLTMILLSTAANSVPKKPAKPAKKVKPTSSKTATSCTLNLMFK